MAKDAYYFSHDCNARNDNKIQALRTKYGVEGYGRYWILIEILREQREFQLKLKEYVYIALSREMECDVDQVKEFIDDCVNQYELFESDGESLWSPSLNARMDRFLKQQEQRRSAGRKGGLKSGKARRSDTQAETESDESEQDEPEAKRSEAKAPLKQRSSELEANEANKIKLNKIKLNKIYYSHTNKPSNSTGEPAENDCPGLKKDIDYFSEHFSVNDYPFVFKKYMGVQTKKPNKIDKAKARSVLEYLYKILPDNSPEDLYNEMLELYESFCNWSRNGKNWQNGIKIDSPTLQQFEKHIDSVIVRFKQERTGVN